MLVGIENDVALLLVVDDDGDDLILELAGVNGGAGAVVADDGQLVALLTGDVAQLCHVVSGDAHVAGGQRVVQGVVDHGVVELGAALGGDAAHAVAHTGLGEHEGSLGHVLHAHHQADIGLAQHHVLAGDLHGPHAGGAVLVDGDSAALDGQADPHGNLTGRQGALHVGVALAHDDLVDGVDVDAGALDRFLAGGDGQLPGGHVLEHALELADGGTAGAYDNNVSGLHWWYPPKIYDVLVILYQNERFRFVGDYIIHEKRPVSRRKSVRPKIFPHSF